MQCGITLDDLVRAAKLIEELRPEFDEMECGRDAFAKLKGALPEATSPSLGLLGVRVVMDPDMPPNVVKLISFTRTDSKRTRQVVKIFNLEAPK